MAIEDIGLADPRALEQAVAAMQAVHFLGIPKATGAGPGGHLSLRRAEIRRRLSGLNQALGDVRDRVAEPVPVHCATP